MGHWGPERDSDLNRVTQGIRAPGIRISVYFPFTEQGSQLKAGRRTCWSLRALLPQGALPSAGERSPLHRRTASQREIDRSCPSVWEQVTQVVLKAPGGVVRILTPRDPLLET